MLGSMPSATTHSLRDGSGTALRLHVGARWMAEALPVPIWAGAGGITVELSRQLSIDASVVASALGQTALAGGRARAKLLAGLEALGCAGTPVGPLWLQTCAGATAAMYEASGADYLVRREATLLWAAGLARLMLRWPQDSFLSLRVVTQGHVNITRAKLLVDGSGASLQPAWVGVTLGIELLLALP
jgi:hypothetical protein